MATSYTDRSIGRAPETTVRLQLKQSQYVQILRENLPAIAIPFLLGCIESLKLFTGLGPGRKEFSEHENL